MRRHRATAVAAAVLLAVGTAGCALDDGAAEPSTATVPDVADGPLKDARAALADAGFTDIVTEDATGRDRNVLMASNWHVCTQAPAAGASADPADEVTLSVAKDGEPCDGDEDQAEPPAEDDVDEAPEGEPTAAEQTYLDALYKAAEEEGSGIKSYGDEWNIDLGHAVCQDIADGMAPTEVVMGLNQTEQDSRLKPISKVSHRLVGLAQMHLCPPE
jgi:hypothetical protein